MVNYIVCGFIYGGGRGQWSIILCVALFMGGVGGIGPLGELLPPNFLKSESIVYTFGGHWPPRCALAP